jgi:polyhydroxybutyrate depolymerase
LTGRLGAGIIGGMGEIEAAMLGTARVFTLRTDPGSMGVIRVNSMWIVGLLLLSQASPVARLEPGDHARSLMFQGKERSYSVHVPGGLDANGRTPVVLVLHAFSMPATLMPGFTGLTELADREGFLAVYPSGTGGAMLNWNEGAMRGKTADDVGFVRAVLDDLGTRHPIDPKRVYATGMSNGAMMCYRLAAELSDRIAAIGPVAGTLAVAPAADVRAVPVIHFHGTEDRFVPYGGPGGNMPRGMSFYSVDRSVAAWVQADGCPQKFVETAIEDRHDDGTRVSRKVYGPGRDGAEVVLYRIEGGGHTWPGRSGAEGMLGRSTKEIDASTLIWEFFRKHPMP